MRDFCKGFLLCLLVVCSACQQKRNLHPDQLLGQLELLTAEKTGITFNNSINETEKNNHLYYSQIYNGAGVAIGDINNDGLSDIFFSGNKVSNRLYLNNGKFQFKDITKQSGVGNNPGWSTGVTMADVNGDGFLDIYVSRSGESMKPHERKNLLYINNGDLTFKESAVAFGLADQGFSSQAVFFDMDNDNDLDVYQVNQPPDPRLLRRYKIPKERQKYYSDKLYRNNNGKYEDVSKQLGKNTLAYGLSVSAADFNGDGWIDLYVANDYDAPDFMFYNTGHGKFRNVINTKLKHISRFSMGTDTGDINNDGLMDLMTLDMAAEDHYRAKTNMGSMSTKAFNRLVAEGKHRQYMFNTLQLNTGNGSFYDIGSIAGVSKTDWSWGTLLVDLDNDGKKDILVSNGIKKDIRNNDYVINVQKDLNSGSKDFLDMSKRTPTKPLANYIFRNKGNLEFEKVAKKWSFDTPAYSSGIAYGDLDNDGDLDIVTNNMDAAAFVYNNKATGNYLKIKFVGPENNQWGYGAKAVIDVGGFKQMAEHTVTRGYFSSVEPGLFFGLGKNTTVDKVIVSWPGGGENVFKNITANTLLIVDYTKAKRVTKVQDINVKTVKEKLFSPINATESGLALSHQENIFDDFEREILLPYKLSQNGPFVATGDVNADNLEDLFIGGAAQQSGTLYLQQRDGQFKLSPSQPWLQDKAAEDLDSVFFDVDGDKDLDLFVASGGSEFEQGSPILQDRLYLNDGQGNFTRDRQGLPPIYESSQNSTVADIDADGDLDLFVGTRLIAGKYPYPASSYLLVNDNGKFSDDTATLAPDLHHIGMVTGAVFTDIDQDGDPDLMVVGEWMNIHLLENQNGTFVNQSKKWGLENTRGLWWSLTAADLDNDGDEDYIVGNLGRNNKFKASVEHPFKIYANDFDKNGTNDVVLASFYKDSYVPVRGRECTSQQMPYVAKKFKDFHSFASSNLQSILPEDTVKDAVVYEISSFESILLINKNGILQQQSLPVPAQVSPIKSSLVVDVNGDGNNDIITVGNHYPVEVETVRYDAGTGTVLLGDGSNNFYPLTSRESGFYVPYDSRDIELMVGNTNNKVLVTNNNSFPSLFIYKK